jgi:uncharacterized small protein (DUF1192 family)
MISDQDERNYQNYVAGNVSMPYLDDHEEEIVSLNFRNMPQAPRNDPHFKVTDQIETVTYIWHKNARNVENSIFSIGRCAPQPDWKKRLFYFGQIYCYTYLDVFQSESVPDFHQYILGARLVPYSTALVLRYNWLKLEDECSIIDYEPCLEPGHEDVGCLPEALSALAKGKTIILKIPREKYQKNGLYKTSRPILASLYSYIPPEARWKTGFSTCHKIEMTMLSKVYSPRIYIVPESCEIPPSDEIEVINFGQQVYESRGELSKASAWVKMSHNKREEFFEKLNKSDSLERQLADLFEMAYSEIDPVHIWWKSESSDKFSDLPSLVARHKDTASWNTKLEIMFSDRVPSLIRDGLIPEDLLKALINDERLPLEQRQSCLEYCRKRMNYLGIGIKRFNAVIERNEEERTVLEEIKEMKNFISAQSSAQIASDKALREHVEKQLNSFSEQSTTTNERIGNLLKKQIELQAFITSLPIEITDALTAVKTSIELYKLDEKFDSVEMSILDATTSINNKFRNYDESLTTLLNVIQKIDSNLSDMPMPIITKLDGLRAAISDVNTVLSKDIKNIQEKITIEKSKANSSVQNPKSATRHIKKTGKTGRDNAQITTQNSITNENNDLMQKLREIERQIGNLKDQIDRYEAEVLKKLKTSETSSKTISAVESKPVNLRTVKINLFIDSEVYGSNPPSIELLDKDNNKMSADAHVQSGKYQILFNGRPIREVDVSDWDVKEDIRLYTYKVLSYVSKIPILFKKETWYEFLTEEQKPTREPYPIKGYKFEGWLKTEGKKFIAIWKKNKKIKNNEALKSESNETKSSESENKGKTLKKKKAIMLSIALVFIAAVVISTILLIKSPFNDDLFKENPDKAMNISNSQGDNAYGR